MGRVSEEYEREASEWDRGGRDAPDADAWLTMVLGCWLGSPGATHDGVSPVLHAYHKALERVLDRKNANWLDDLFERHEYCGYCGQSWREENCSICTSCAASFPPCCGDRRQFVTLPNGNRECPSCHRGEIVG